MKEYEIEVQKELARSPPSPEEWERLRRAGYLSRDGEPAAAFAIVVFAKVTLDVGSDLAHIANLLTEAVVSRMRGCEWNSMLSSILFSPMVLNPAVARFEDSIRNRKRASARVGLNIDHATWAASTGKQRVTLVSDCLAHAFRSLSPRSISERDLDAVLKVLDAVTSEVSEGVS